MEARGREELMTCWGNAHEILRSHRWQKLLGKARDGHNEWRADTHGTRWGLQVLSRADMSANATRCEAVSSLPLSSYKPCTPHVLLCSPHGACQSCLSDAWCVFLLPSRAYAIRVCPTLSCSLSWIRHLGRINATKCEAVCSLCRCF